MTPDMTIIIADDHPLFRGAMRQALSGMEGQRPPSSRRAISRPRARPQPIVRMPISCCWT